MAQTIVILGGTSEIGLAVARRYAQQGWHVILTARQIAALAADGADLQIRGAASVRVVACDMLQPAEFPAVIDAVGGVPDMVVCAVGLLGNQREAEHDATLAQAVMMVNYTGPALLLGAWANQMQARGSGVIIGISSVAGDRGRASNYMYGSAKAGFTAFLSGLRQRLRPYAVQVITVKPGFVATRMTAGMALPKRLTAQPEDVADAILQAAARRRSVVYVYPVWRWIMAMICHIPEAVFQRIRL